MILEWILGVVFALLEMILRLLPAATPITWPTMPAYARWVGQIVDVPALVTVLGIILTYEVAMLVVRFALWTWKRLPIGG